MTTSPTWLNDWMAVAPLPDETILLDEDTTSEDTTDLSHIPLADRWAYRLQQLATQGFTSWMQVREPSLSCSDFDPHAALASPLHVGEFKVCLLPACPDDDEIAVPQAAVEQTSRAAHFYIAISIDEEAEVADIVGFLPYTEIVAQCDRIPPDIDHTYPLPTAVLNPDTSKLLLFLQCLSPNAIALPSVQSSTLAMLTAELGRPIANARTWLQRQVDTLAPQIEQQIGQLTGGWQLIPAGAMRLNTAASIRDQLLAAMQANGLPALPAAAGIAHQVVTIANAPVRLFAAVWPLTAGEWMLFVIVCPPPGQALPPDLGLVIDEITPGRSQSELVREASGSSQSDNQSGNTQARQALFGYVKGDRHDVFDISLTVSNSPTNSGPNSDQRWSTAIQFQLEG